MLCVILPAAPAERDHCFTLQMRRLSPRETENLLVVGFKSGVSDSRTVAFQHYAMTESQWGHHPGAERGPCGTAVSVHMFLK